MYFGDQYFGEVIVRQQDGVLLIKFVFVFSNLPCASKNDLKMFTLKTNKDQ